MTKLLLSSDNVKGFVDLLKDSEEKTLTLMAEQLSSFDPKSIQMIDELAENSKDNSLLDNWYHASRISLHQQLKDWRKAPDLERGLFILARMKNPGLDEDRYSRILDGYADRVKSRIHPASTQMDIVNAINEVLFKEENYTGNQISYYDLNNNFINSVIDTHSGNPIMLSSIYMLVARRLKLEIKGVGTPGHFIVQFGDLMLDPFFGGREVTKDECIIRAQELSVFWRDEYLDTIDDLMMIARCIRNLIAIYKKQNDLERAADASGLLKIV